MLEELLNVKKKYVFKAPFDIYNTDLELTLVGLPDIGALSAGLVDVFELVYKPVGLSKDDLASDIRSNVKLMTFKTTASDYLYIPQGYLEDNVSDGVRMVGKVLIFNLGAVLLEEDFDSSQLANDCASLITNVTGIVPTYTFSNITGVTHVSRDEISAYMAKRVYAKNTEDNSYYSKYIRTKELLDETTQRLALLESTL